MLSKFLNTRTLVIILVVLGGIFLVTKLTQKEDRTFRSELVTIDTSRVTKMVIIPKTGAGTNINFTRSGYDWTLESEGKSYTPDEGAIDNILVELTRMRTERVAAIDESKWNEFEVTDSTASRIQLFNNDEVIADLYLGKFSYTQSPQTNPMQRQQTRMFTHVRPVDDKTVYVVEGFIKMSVQPNVNTYRAKVLCAMNQDDITKISFNYPNNKKFTLQGQEGKWYLNGEETDSTKTARYLMKFVRLSNNNFVDDPSVPVSDTPSHSVVLEGNNTLPVEIRAYPSADTTHQYLITSSLVPDAKYSGYKSRLFDKVFVTQDDFFVTEEE
jgi:hypothetical protein